MIPIVGYVDRFSARPGERIGVKVSSRLKGDYVADIVRIVHADPNPAGPGMKLLPVPSACEGAYPSRFQPAHPGSCAIARLTAPFALPEECTICLRVQPWLLDAAPHVAMAMRLQNGRVLSIGVAAEGAWVSLGEARMQVPAPMVPRRWYELRLLLGGGRARLVQTPLRQTFGVQDAGEARMPMTMQPVSLFCFGAEPTRPVDPDEPPLRHVLDGRIEDPMLLHGRNSQAAPLEPERMGAAVICWWDFSSDMSGLKVTDRGQRGFTATLHNLPTRGVRGSRWDGTAMAWRQAPRHYAALHCHADDLYDCGWDTDFIVPIPDDMPSAVYGVRLRGMGAEAGAEDIVPFYVLPPRGKTTAPVAFLAPTFTYQIYGNHDRGNVDEAYRARRAAWPGAAAWNPQEAPQFGVSTYNRHPDGSGVCYASARRPLLTMRPGFLTFVDRKGSGLRHFPADSHITDWLEARGFDYDVITDHDLDAEGVGLLRNYRAVLTGSHPEYHTARTLDALQAYVTEGGRLCYLGGNGFYWRIATGESVPDVLEVRRAEGGIRAWAAEPGEYYHALDGEYGGLWRRNGRPPQMLAGVGFSAQGLFEGSYYRRMPGAADPRAAWIFDGIPDEVLGNFGLSGGGAAGFELDRADPALGTPPHALILARSEGHQAHFMTVPEELLSHLATLNGEKPAALIRAEIVYFETARGGAVFSTGSITFCGSLSHNRYDNNISRMLENVLLRFSAA
jgi:N,N-dimethylformamidase